MCILSCLLADDNAGDWDLRHACATQAKREGWRARPNMSGICFWSTQAWTFLPPTSGGMPCCCWVKHYFWSTRGSCLWHRTTITTSKLVGQIYRIGQAHLGMAPIQSMSVWKSFGIQEGGREGYPIPRSSRGILPSPGTSSRDVLKLTNTSQLPYGSAIEFKQK